MCKIIKPIWIDKITSVLLGKDLLFWIMLVSTSYIYRHLGQITLANHLWHLLVLNKKGIGTE